VPELALDMVAVGQRRLEAVQRLSDQTAPEQVRVYIRARAAQQLEQSIELVDCLSLADSTNTVRRVAVGPAKWATGLVVGPDVLHQLAPQIRGRGEDAAREAVALDLGKRELSGFTLRERPPRKSSY
jgi:hypothetical protein